MILPDTEAGVWHARRRIMTFPGLKRNNTTMIATLITSEANRSGIIRLTFMA
jgi:hypothetical protein